MNLDGSVVKVTRAHGEAYRNALKLPLGELEPRTEVVAIVDFDRMSFRLKGLLELSHLLKDPGLFLFCLEYRNHHDLDGSELRRKDKTVIVAMGHHKGTHKTGGNAPGSGPDILHLAFLVSVLYIE